MLQVDFRSSSSCCPSSSTSSPYRSLPSVPENGLHNDILNMSPQLSYHSGSIAHLEKTWHDQSSLHMVLEKALGCSSNTVIPSTGIPISKSTAELIKEIAVLEVEVMHLERYLLSLYQRAFEHHLATLPSTVMDKGSRSHLQCKTGSPLPDVMNQSCCHEDICMWRSGRSQHNLTSPARGSAGSDNHIYPPPPKEISKRDPENADSGLRSLADHLGASLIDQVPETPDKLSEDIVRCMSAIYCRLANPPLPHISLSATPISSLSSSSTLSPQDLHDNWSPRCKEEATVSPCQPEDLNEKTGPYAALVEVTQICVDDDRFKYAATMLQNFRSLVQRLEKVDLRKMTREEKLAFWINIHNALVMHAYLAYGIHNRMRNTSVILKAAYNVGGHSINAYIIQSTILGCCQRHSASWLQTFFLPGRKLRTGNGRHTYALDYPEPLVHFALCSGAYSDPAVRVYTAKSVFQELNLAKEEFIQARVSIDKRTKVILPKILYYFAKDASLNLNGLLEMVCACVSDSQQNGIQRCLKGKPDKYIEWSPYKLTFRYIIHRELAKGRTII